MPAEEISRHHAKLQVTADGVLVEDMSSANGTFINDKRIQTGVLKPGEELSAEAVRAFCQGQIAHYKIPRHTKFVDGFPTTVTGKVQKFAMREAMIAELDLAVEKTA